MPQLYYDRNATVVPARRGNLLHFNKETPFEDFIVDPTGFGPALARFSAGFATVTTRAHDKNLKRVFLFLSANLTIEWLYSNALTCGYVV